MFDKPLLAACLLLRLITLLLMPRTPQGTADGKSVVYDDVTNTTWTGDANLLGTL